MKLLLIAFIITSMGKVKNQMNEKKSLLYYHFIFIFNIQLHVFNVQRIVITKTKRTK
jgi:hypothetical protein